MEKVYQPYNFKLSFETSQGTTAILICTLLGFLLLLALFAIIYIFLSIVHGDLEKLLLMLWEILRSPPEEMRKYFFNALRVFILGGVYLVLAKVMLKRTITVREREIESYVFLNRIYKFFSPRSQKRPRTVIAFSELEQVWTDVMYYNGHDNLRTVLTAGDRTIEFMPGFVGYFEILAELETRALQAVWDDDTRLILDRHRQAIPLRKTEKLLIKQTKARFKDLVPSYWQRRRLIAQVRKYNRYFYRDLIARAGPKSD